MNILRLSAAASAVVTIGLGTAAAGAAASPAAPSGGSVRVWATPSGNGLHVPIVITGVIADYGTATSISANGTPNPNGNYERLTLHHGSFEANSVALNAKADKTPPVVNAATCSGYFSVSGAVTLLKGTGLYKGISGTVHITETFAFIGPRYTSGAKKGQCNESGMASPVASFSSLVGFGTVHFA